MFMLQKYELCGWTEFFKDISIQKRGEEIKPDVARQAICIYFPVQAFDNDLNSVGYWTRNYYSQQQKESLCLSALVLWHDFCFNLLDLTASKPKWKC